MCIVDNTTSTIILLGGDNLRVALGTTVERSNHVRQYCLLLLVALDSSMHNVLNLLI